MSGRQYGIVPGSHPDGTRAPVSPMSFQDSPRSGYFPQTGHSQQYSGAGRSSPAAREVSREYSRQTQAPRPPPHRSTGPPSPTRYSYSSARDQPSTAPDHGRFAGTAVGGSTFGFGTGLDPRDSGMQALRDIDNLYGGYMPSPSPEPSMEPPRPHLHQHTTSHSSVAPLMSHQPSPPRASALTTAVYSAEAPGAASATSFDGRMPHNPHFHGDGYDDFDPRDIAEDGDDGLDEAPHTHHRGYSGAAAAGVGAGAAAGLSGKGSLFPNFGSRNPSGNYATVHDAEKSDWLQKQNGSNKRMRWLIGILVALVLIGAIVGGTVGGILANKNSSNGSSGSSSSSSSSSGSSGGLYDANSDEVKQLLNNENLHKVFPGMDYTPLNAQYPDCLSNPPDQNNVTLDVAVMSQLTPAIRLYGTDCNQTEMVLESISRLGYTDSLKVWLGVWLGSNQTTNTRQLDQMYDILDTYPADQFAGVIVGNEVLFREDMTPAELGNVLSGVRKNLTAKGINLPVSTSDLGDNWTAGLAAESDIIMANVHPFFAGVTPDVAPGWTYNFFEKHDAVFTPANTGSYPKSVISETGWPSSGGHDCGTDSGSCPTGQGAIASVDNMNTFMADFVCNSITNGTTYFWFEAFDEPWKVIFNTQTDQWESKWGLFDSNRNMKDGLEIPDCGGRTVEKPY